MTPKQPRQHQKHYDTKYVPKMTTIAATIKPTSITEHEDSNKQTNKKKKEKSHKNGNCNDSDDYINNLYQKKSFW